MTTIKYGSIKIDRLQSSSGLFIGKNDQKRRTNQSTMNEGFGKISGNCNNVNANIGIVKKQ